MAGTIVDELLLGTVAIEPNRWRTVHADGRPVCDLRTWLPSIAALPVDGIEVWDRHLTSLDPTDADEVAAGPPPVRVFNSYVDFDDPDDTERDRVADQVRRSGARAVKFNVGNDQDAENAYVERLARWLDGSPPTSPRSASAIRASRSPKIPPSPPASWAAPGRPDGPRHSCTPTTPPRCSTPSSTRSASASPTST